MPTDAELRVHRDWIGLLQPVGLVVSPPALAMGQAFPDRNIIPQQQALLGIIDQDGTDQRRPVIRDFAGFTQSVLGWRQDRLAGAERAAPLAESLQIVLPEFDETLRPTYAVASPPGDLGDWIMLIQDLLIGTPFDQPLEDDGRHWHASPQARLERMLRESGVPVGLLFNGGELRLVYAPRGESTGYMTWPVYALTEVAGRPLLSALCMLLGSPRLFSLPRHQRLPHLLSESRKYQNIVSAQLGQQVLEALNELLRGFQAANEADRAKVLDAAADDDPEHVYGGLLAVILRLVFALYAEERGLLSSSATYVRGYSLGGLFEQLRADQGHFPDTMDQRYGAWARLLVLFRIIHDGARHGDFRLPARQGHLFDPDTWGFLEGRSRGTYREKGGPVAVPKVPDGTILRVLEKLLLLDGDRLSYLALDVEQIGSVYQGMIGFRLERATETSIALGKEHVVVGLETLLQQQAAERNRYLKESAGVELTGTALDGLRRARSVDDALAALHRRISPLTPRPIPPGRLFLQPTDERRRSGSHYTPRELTEPIVRKTLQPVLDRLGPDPTPEQILALKICDLAMGSGAFLVETCRQLAEVLVTSYDVHGRPYDVPPDEDIVLYTQRQVAQRCLYGVDRNPFAVDLAKLSLWLATLAKDHPFTFVDHALRCGDSLVGLTRRQIECFHWKEQSKEAKQTLLFAKEVAQRTGAALREREALLAVGDDFTSPLLKQQKLAVADERIELVRAIGDAAIAAFFSADKEKARQQKRLELAERFSKYLAHGDLHERPTEAIADLRSGRFPVAPFHWEVEFPEVFDRQNPGFDAFVGNPPFVQGRAVAKGAGAAYRDWLQTSFDDWKASADLVSLFFRRAFDLLRNQGTFGLIATKTISKGDTRSSGLRWICKHGGTIYSAKKRYRWPGAAAVVVSVVHIKRGLIDEPELDGVRVPTITAFLFTHGGHDDPLPLAANRGICFNGCSLYGVGFTFDDEESRASSLAEMRSLIERDPRNAARIRPFLGGDDVNSDPLLVPRRWVIYFGTMPLEKCRAWPDLLRILESRVRPERQRKAKDVAAWPWWQFWRQRPELMVAIEPLDRMLAVSFVSEHLGFVWLPTDRIVSHNVGVFADQRDSFFCVVQSRVHEVFATQLSSGLEDRQGYRPSDGFEPFPFPLGWESNAILEAAGQEYYQFRADLMARNNEGLTKTYNRFHSPHEVAADIVRLRDLHAQLDHAVLNAYGWTDLAGQCQCEYLLNYEEEDEDEGSTRRHKKPWRYRWPDNFRDEVLARLLRLNAERAQQERSMLAAWEGGPLGAPPPRRARSNAGATAGQSELI